jgi:hypothetical protein
MSNCVLRRFVDIFLRSWNPLYIQLILKLNISSLVARWRNGSASDSSSIRSLLKVGRSNRPRVKRHFLFCPGNAPRVCVVVHYVASGQWWILWVHLTPLCARSGLFFVNQTNQTPQPSQKNYLLVPMTSLAQIIDATFLREALLSLLGF